MRQYIRSNIGLPLGCLAGFMIGRCFDDDPTQWWDVVSAISLAVSVFFVPAIICHSLKR
jgi:hypothetical protein